MMFSFDVFSRSRVKGKGDTLWSSGETVTLVAFTLGYESRLEHFWRTYMALFPKVSSMFPKSRERA